MGDTTKPILRVSDLWVTFPAYRREPVRALKGFKRIKLAPGETQRISFELRPDTLAIWNMENKYTVEPSHLTVWMGPDSAHGSEASLEIVP